MEKQVGSLTQHIGLKNPALLQLWTGHSYGLDSTPSWELSCTIMQQLKKKKEGRKGKGHVCNRIPAWFPKTQPKLQSFFCGYVCQHLVRNRKVHGDGGHFRWEWAGKGCSRELELYLQFFFFLPFFNGCICGTGKLPG